MQAAYDAAMNFKKLVASILVVFSAVLSVSCGSLPEPKKDLGPKSEHSQLPWARRQPWEGQGAMGGLGSR